MMKTFLGVVSISLSLLFGCAPEKRSLTAEVMAGRWSNDASICETSYVTLTESEMRLHENGKARRVLSLNSIKDVPDVQNGVAMEIHYPDEPEGKNKALIILQLENNVLVPKGLGTPEGYALVTKPDDPFIKAFTLHRCA